MAEVGKRDTEVGEGDVEVFFDVPISFEGNIEEENEEANEENDNEFEESEYESDADNPMLSKFDGIMEKNERESKHRKEMNSEQTNERDFD